MKNELTIFEKIIIDSLLVGSVTSYNGKEGYVVSTPSFALFLPGDYNGVLNGILPNTPGLETAISRVDLLHNRKNAEPATVNSIIVNRTSAEMEDAFLTDHSSILIPTRVMIEETAHNILRQFTSLEYGSVYVNKNILDYYGKSYDKLKKYTFAIVKIECNIPINAVRVNSPSNTPEILISIKDQNILHTL